MEALGMWQEDAIELRSKNKLSAFMHENLGDWRRGREKWIAPRESVGEIWYHVLVVRQDLIYNLLNKREELQESSVQIAYYFTGLTVAG